MGARLASPLLGASLAGVLLGAAMLGHAGGAEAQGAAPKLSKEQRQSLLAALTAVKNAADAAATVEGFQVHLLRASDGSHYVAVSAEVPPELTPESRLALYVRLAPRPPADTTAPQVVRSAVEEWLLGQRNDPLPMRASGVVQVPSGELPIGTYGTLSRDGSGQNSSVLTLVDRERQRQRDAAEAAEKERRAEMEGRGRQEPTLMPFEDFDLDARAIARQGRGPVIRRALTAGPGDYDLYFGWAVLDSRNRATTTGALRHALSLPTNPGGLALGSVIVADDISARTELFRADQQTAHPYTIGTTHIEPAADAVFTNDERLSVAFQVFNAAASPTGKPDVGVGFRLFRLTEKGEQPAGSLTPLDYSEASLPADFNLLLGHPILAAMAAPLRTLARGDYRLAIAATDRIARTSATADLRFRVVATPAALLAGAPEFSARVRRARFSDADIISAAIDALPTSARTPAAAPLLDRARERRFVELLPDAAIPAATRGMGLLWQAVAGYALGDTPATIAVQLRRALDAGAPEGAARFWLGACWAAEGKDEDALEAWEAARKADWPLALVATPAAEALVRLNRLEEAGSRARQALEQGVRDPELTHIAAAADVAGGRYDRAVALLTPALAADPEDEDATWLMLHALFASAVNNARPGSTPEGRAEFETLARRYAGLGGRNRLLAEEWLAYLTASSAP